MFPAFGVNAPVPSVVQNPLFAFSIVAVKVNGSRFPQIVSPGPASTVGPSFKLNFTSSLTCGQTPETFVW